MTLGKLPGLSSEDSREGNSPDPAGLWCGLSRAHIGRSAQQGSSSTPHSCQQHPSLWRGRESPLRTPVSRLANCRSADKVPGLGHLCALSPAGAGHTRTRTASLGPLPGRGHPRSRGSRASQTCVGGRSSPSDSARKIMVRPWQGCGLSRVPRGEAGRRGVAP